LASTVVTKDQKKLIEIKEKVSRGGALGRFILSCMPSRSARPSKIKQIIHLDKVRLHADRLTDTGFGKLTQVI